MDLRALTSIYGFTIHRTTRGNDGTIFLFLSTTSTRSRTFRYLFATLHVRLLTHICNRVTCNYQNPRFTTELLLENFGKSNVRVLDTCQYLYNRSTDIDGKILNYMLLIFEYLLSNDKRIAVIRNSELWSIFCYSIPNLLQMFLHSHFHLAPSFQKFCKIFGLLVKLSVPVNIRYIIHLLLYTCTPHTKNTCLP